MTLAAGLFDHLAAMTDDQGLFEHAEFAVPRPEHGYCTDDNARLLVVVSREQNDPVADRLGQVAFRFVELAMSEDGMVRNRMTTDGTFSDAPSTDDCWGRALWGLGTAAAQHHNPNIRRRAARVFRLGARQRSRWPRSMAFAALGAAELLAFEPGDATARSLLTDAATTIGRPRSNDWVWTEDRLTYANAALAEALIAAGAGLDVRSILDDGLAMLDWLLERWTRCGWLSVTGSEGDVDHRASFDQQPLEVAAVADACWRANAVQPDARWVAGIVAADRWFDGDNDALAVVQHADNGGSFDGLRRNGVNLNQGAESTLALVSTRQRARSLDRLHR